ncbi:hypothetical protein Syun_021882 [Stephania yunnanensis]|uniref:Purple acid phosphatase n=1 Tax=Stephania yunnanensis TaxID=152371 RepID=A0AAP0IGW5_9MAGN
MACFLNKSIPSSLLLLIFCFISTTADLQRLRHEPSYNDDALNFLVVGDWGRKGQYNQSKVALQMGRIAEELDMAFVVSTGDNFYEDGLTGVTDPDFRQSFTNIYTSKSLKMQWYNILGNHDYRGDVEAQLDPILRSADCRWLCMRSFVVNAQVADLFFIDTTPFVDKYFTHPGGHVYDWRGVLPRKNYIQNLLKDVEFALKESTATWKVVIGHHPIRSVGQHGDTQELVEQLLPILEDNNVHLYINGHDHCLQRISSSDGQIQFLTSGGGSKAWRGEVKDDNAGEIEFYYDGQGFMSVQLTHSDVHIAFYDVFGNALHKWSAPSSNQLNWAI